MSCKAWWLAEAHGRALARRRSPARAPPAIAPETHPRRHLPVGFFQPYGGCYANRFQVSPAARALARPLTHASVLGESLPRTPTRAPATATQVASTMPEPAVMASASDLRAVARASSNPTRSTVEPWRRLRGGELYAASSRVEWAVLLRRTYRIDALRSPICAGRTCLMSTLTDPCVVKKNPRAPRPPQSSPCRGHGLALRPARRASTSTRRRAIGPAGAEDPRRRTMRDTCARGGGCCGTVSGRRRRTSYCRQGHKRPNRWGSAGGWKPAPGGKLLDEREGSVPTVGLALERAGARGGDVPRPARPSGFFAVCSPNVRRSP